MVRLRKKSKKRIRIKRLLLLFLIVYLFLKIDDFGRELYPFPYRQAITHQAIANGVDPFLFAALIKTESNFNPDATSKAGARGLVQIMPETGQWIAQQMNLVDFTSDKLYHPQTSIKMGAWYLANLNKEFQGSQVLTLAAYNAGRGNVQKWLAEQHWTGEEQTIDQIPFPETRHYIRKVNWNYKVYKYLYDGT
ncbi:lytic transglycosylase domain-containing protein [Peptococcaceae bacterium 1198_IL3148]